MSEALFSPDLIETVRQAKHTAVLTGAGVSAESGIPTFRDAQQGLWAKYRPEELATREAFKQDPQRVWDWYAFRRQMITSAQPNPGHFALTSLEQSSPSFTLITQNIDGLHQAAGSRHILELHGSIWRAKCFLCEHLYTGNLDIPHPPVCTECAALMRPDVVWFGEPLPKNIFEEAANAVRSCDLFFIIGTSALIQPAASLPFLAIEKGTPCVEINPQSTPLTQWATYSLRGRSGEILPALISTLIAQRKTK